MSAATYVHGVQAVRAALRYDPSQALEAWLDPRRRDHRIRRLREQLAAADCPVHSADRATLDRLAAGEPHQGVVLRYKGPAARGDDELADWLDGLGHPPLVLVLDQVQDPHNLGACLRVADGAGIDALIAPRDRAAGLSTAVHKVASGASHTVPFFQITNLARGLRMLSERGIKLIGAGDEAEQAYYACDLTGPLGLVLGAEQRGLRRLTREACTGLVAIPMRGSVESLNVAVAAGVLAFEAARQRRAFA